MKPRDTSHWKKGENKAAIKQPALVNNYVYSALVVPGDGPGTKDIRLAPASIERCRLVAERFNDKLAPLIILTGGHCHPFSNALLRSSGDEKIFNR